ncbi:MAG: gamma-glutamyl-gamma-aminobutyrate hydrolase family protein [Acidimicrobiales bacterium]|nr:gamma-glutamyl-gamma-aminobutyrate hydrolase family protein [Acidimicrobiales bacterium]
MSPPPPPGDRPDPTNAPIGAFDQSGRANAPNLGATANSSGDESSTNRRQRPLIGITTYPPNDRDRFDLPAEYVASVRRAGADVILVPPGGGDPAALLDRLDGLVLSGGGDVDPALFGGGPHETVYSLHPDRDRDELVMARRVLETELATLAICRGSQVLNVALGGTLHVHLPDVVGETVVHRDEPAIRQGMPGPLPHDVTVEPDSLVAKIMEAEHVAPMSWHHQAVDRLGEGLRAVAWAPDGTIEATQHEAHPWLASVQWHPELTADRDLTQQRLFDALVRAAQEGM